MTEQTFRKRRHLFRVSFPKAMRLFSPGSVKRSQTSRDFTSSPTSITSSSTGKTAGRLRDRSTSGTSSVATSSTDEYIERCSLSPGYDKQLAGEIKRRQSSAVRMRINKYNQLNAKSKMSPPLTEVRGNPLSRRSQIYARVQSFEQIEADSKKFPGPSLEELRKRRENRPPRSKSTVLPPPLYTL